MKQIAILSMAIWVLIILLYFSTSEEVISDLELRENIYRKLDQLHSEWTGKQSEYAELEAQQDVIQDFAMSVKQDMVKYCRTFDIPMELASCSALCGDVPEAMTPRCPKKELEVIATGTPLPTPELTGCIADQGKPCNLVSVKPYPRRRLNKNGVSQRPYFLEAEGINARAKELLLRSNNDPKVREDIVTIGELRSIKPELLLCMWYTENSLNGSQKGANNPLNNWNNDRGDTVSYKKEILWRNAAAQTLNNKYLWQYEEVRQLYGSSNPKWPNYATERNQELKQYSGNWLVNTLNCIWMLNGTGVDGSYRFRSQ